MSVKVTSLRGRLLALIILPLLIIVSIGTIVLYYDSEKKSQQIYDKLLHSISQVILRDVVISEGDLLTEQLLETLTDTINDQIFYQVRDEKGGSLYVGYANPPELPVNTIVKPYTPVFFDSVYRDQAVRVIASREFVAALETPDWVTIYVWQTTIGQKRLLLELASSAFVTMMIMLLSTALIVWFGVKFGLKPLLDLQSAIKKRSADDLARIKRTVPMEVSSLVNSMNKLFDQLRSAFAERDDFIANAAHQLRNPIAGIQSQAEAAERSKNLESMKQRVGDVVTAARKTSRLTQQLLSMEHVSQQSIKSEFQTLDLVKLTQETLANLAIRAQQQNVALSLECKESQIELHGSETFLSEAIDNLIDNALAYGCPNGGKIDVEIKLDDADVHLYVQDYGKGIDPKLITKVLERFVHGPDTNGEGSGLGLSIAKTIIELHGGELELLSEGQGTRVHIKIPL